MARSGKTQIHPRHLLWTPAPGAGVAIGPKQDAVMQPPSRRPPLEDNTCLSPRSSPVNCPIVTAATLPLNHVATGRGTPVGEQALGGSERTSAPTPHWLHNKLQLWYMFKRKKLSHKCHKKIQINIYILLGWERSKQNTECRNYSKRTSEKCATLSYVRNTIHKMKR